MKGTALIVFCQDSDMHTCMLKRLPIEYQACACVHACTLFVEGGAGDHVPIASSEQKQIS